MYQCPKCQGSLTVVMTEGDKLDKCVQCGGLWFDKGELLNMLDKGLTFRADGAQKENYDQLDQEGGDCPLCRGTELIKIVADYITIEQCPSCKGVWLDQGEYTAMLEADAADTLKQLLQEG